MPTLNATVFDSDARVLVETWWGDSSGARCVQVRRVITSTGESAPLRTYVFPCSESGEYQHLSGGIATFWDTEAPLDEPFTYEADAVDADGNLVGVSDAYPGSSGGLVTLGVTGTASTPDNAALDITGDIDIRIDMTLTDAEWFSTAAVVLISKYEASTNNRSYRFYIENGLLRFAWSNNGTTVLGDSPDVAHIPAEDGRLAVRVTLDVDNGAAQRVLTFYQAPTIAGPWTQLGASITTAGATSIFNSVAVVYVGADALGGVGALLTGLVHSAEIRNGIDGTVVSNPYFYSQDNRSTGFTDGAGRVWTVTSPGYIAHNTDATVITAGPYVLTSAEEFWLRDPVRPCNDRRILLCFDPSDSLDCTPGESIFFVEMGQEGYSPNSTLLTPTNARRPIAIARQRRDTASQLTVATRTFEDRDAVLELNEPGSPLLFQAPPAYGIPDRYMSIGEISVVRGLPNHTYQVRLIGMPFVTVDRPVGPSQGICGARFEDLCDIYATWADAETSGLAWSTLITGTAEDLGFRTWDDTLADFGTWTNVLANGTWLDNRDGN